MKLLILSNFFCSLHPERRKIGLMEPPMPIAQRRIVLTNCVCIARQNVAASQESRSDLSSFMIGRSAAASRLAPCHYNWPPRYREGLL
ncbi:hypothetical protein [Sphingosinicella sp.]|uniref:hypothetical protein n=1 Tax=Sphingosinicella sp. TaxID=1917971 RepID=UPI0035AF9A7D